MDYSKSPNIIDRLANMVFKSSDFVQVMNIDDEVLEWEYCTEEDIAMSPDGLTAQRHSKVEKFKLDPGQTTEMPGYIAFVFIDKLVKHLIQKDGRAKMVNVISIQDEWIERIFLGKKAVDLPYATNSIDPDSGSKSFRAAELVKDPLDEIPFPEVEVPAITQEPKSGRPAKATA